MTNKERLISLIGFAPPANALDGALLDLGIVGADTYTAANSVDVKKAAIQVIQVILSTADTINENEFQIKYDRPSLIKYLDTLKSEVGDDTALAPTITSKPVW